MALKFVLLALTKDELKVAQEVLSISEPSSVIEGKKETEKPNNQRSRAVTSNGDFMIYPAAASLPTVSNTGHHGHYGCGGCGGGRHHGGGGGCGGGGGGGGDS